MRKRVLFIFLAAVVVVSLAAFVACGKEAPEPTEEWQWPDRLVLATLTTTSPNYGALVAWSTPLGQDTGMAVRVICEDSTQLQQMWVKDGRIFMFSPHQNRGGIYGAKGWTFRDQGPFQSRIFLPAGTSYSSFVVLANSSIQTVYDIKPGTKIRIMGGASEEPRQQEFAMLAWGNINPRDIQWVFATGTGNAGQWLMDGRVEAALGYHTSTFWYEVEASPYGARWLAFDAVKEPQAAERFLEWYPWMGFGAARDGVPSSEGVPMQMSMTKYIISDQDDPELVYRLVKWTDENLDRFIEGHPYCKEMTVENLVLLAQENYEPMAEGVIRYLEEKGLWTPELQARQDYNIELLQEWVDAYQAAIKMADDQGVTVNPNNADWQTLWENYRDSLNLPLLVYYQAPGKAQPTYKSFYDVWTATQKEVLGM